MDIAKYVGDKIRYFRTKKGITQRELGEYLKTTSQTVSRYETGTLEIGHNTLFQLADYFNVSINDFFPHINTMEPEADEHYKQILRDKGLMDENDYIDEEKLDDLLKIADMMKNFSKKED